MEKILLALDRSQINMNVVDFACYIAELSRSELTIVFLQEELDEPAAAGRLEMQGQVHGRTPVFETKPDIKPVEDSLFLCESACRERGIRFRIHQSEGNPLTELISETRFADLLVVDPEISLGKRREAVPTSFIKNVLTNSECPVVISPYAFNGVEEIVFAYDGSASASFAMKQFSYLFSGLADFRLTILQVSEETPAPLIEKKKLIEFLQMHYSSVGYRIIEGKASDELFRFLHDKKNLFVVMGAYGRKNLASLLRPSTADLLLKTVNLPIFIAHKD